MIGVKMKYKTKQLTKYVLGGIIMTYLASFSADCSYKFLDYAWFWESTTLLSVVAAIAFTVRIIWFLAK